MAEAAIEATDVATILARLVPDIVLGVEKDLKFVVGFVGGVAVVEMIVLLVKSA